VKEGRRETAEGRREKAERRSMRRETGQNGEQGADGGVDAMVLGRYSIGIGDRFGRQGEAQLRALTKARDDGLDVVPVWNKSHREHLATHSTPDSVREEADGAVRALGWEGAYHVDADHIGMGNVDLFLAASDFFTLDVADSIGQAADAESVRRFVDRHQDLVGELAVPGIPSRLVVSEAQIEAIAEKFLTGVEEAGRIYRHIAEEKAEGGFLTEVSMDETDAPQSPVELLFILAAIADEGIPAQTIAPKFTGRFNKGVDYVGDVARFTAEFRADLAVIAFAVERFGLPENLKLSVHSGSDKFAIYGPMNEAIREWGAGLHLKTAGTTWLEELIGLALAGGEGLEVAQAVYAQSLERYDELCAPYAAVIDTDPGRLPDADTVRTWDGAAFARALRHDPLCPEYNLHFRQLLHVGYKVAADMGDAYLLALDRFREVVGAQVSENIYARHLMRVFSGV